MYICSCILTRLVRKVAGYLIFATSLLTKTTELPELLWLCVFLCVCLSGVGYGAAEPGEQAVNRLSGQWTSSLGHQLPAGGESGCLLLCFLCPTDAENSRPPFPKQLMCKTWIRQNEISPGVNLIIMCLVVAPASSLLVNGWVFGGCPLQEQS